MKKVISLLAVIILLFSTASVFAQQIQCPGNTNFVNVGDTIDQIVSQCGHPQKTIQLKKNVYAWIYSLMTFGKSRIGFSILFENNVVKDMVTTQKIHKTTIKCPRGSINIGNTPAQVQKVCGKPTVVRNYSQQADQISGNITHLIYQPHSYLPRTTFIFQDGQLVGSQ